MHLLETNNNLQKFSYRKCLIKDLHIRMQSLVINIAIRNIVIGLKPSKLIGSAICTEINYTRVLIIIFPLKILPASHLNN